MTMADIAALRELKAKVDAETDRLDDETLGRLICAVRGWSFSHVRLRIGDDGMLELQIVTHPGRFRDWNELRHSCPDVSIDAAVVLVERALPGWRRVIGREDDYAWATICSGADLKIAFGARGATEALALLSALLAALIAKEEGKAEAA